MQKVTKDEAWAFAIGLDQIDGGKVSDEMLKVIEREKRGEITSEDIHKYLEEKYTVKGEGNP